MPTYAVTDYASMVINMSQLSEDCVYGGTFMGCPMWFRRMLSCEQLARRIEAVEAWEKL